jgi:hypothetical protein
VKVCRFEQAQYPSVKVDHLVALDGG